MEHEQTTGKQNKMFRNRPLKHKEVRYVPKHSLMSSDENKVLKQQHKHLEKQNEFTDHKNKDSNYKN